MEVALIKYAFLLIPVFIAAGVTMLGWIVSIFAQIHSRRRALLTKKLEEVFIALEEIIVASKPAATGRGPQQDSLNLLESTQRLNMLISLYFQKFRKLGDLSKKVLEGVGRLASVLEEFPAESEAQEYETYFNNIFKPSYKSLHDEVKLLRQEMLIKRQSLTGKFWPKDEPLIIRYGFNTPPLAASSSRWLAMCMRIFNPGCSDEYPAGAKRQATKSRACPGDALFLKRQA